MGKIRELYKIVWFESNGSIPTLLFWIFVVPFIAVFLIFWMNIGAPLYEKLTGKKAWNPK